MDISTDTSQNLGTDPLAYLRNIKPPDIAPELAQQKALNERRMKESDANMQAQSRVMGQQSEVIKDTQQQLGGIQSKMKDVPQFQERTVSTKEMTDFGSIAMAFAALGSFATRRHMINALTGAAGALNGFDKGMNERAAQDLKTFKAQSDAAIAENNALVQKYNNVLNNKNLSLQQMEAQLKIIGMQDGHQAMVAKLEQGGIVEAIKAKEKQSEWGLKVAEAQTKAGESFTRMKETAAYRQEMLDMRRSQQGNDIQVSPDAIEIGAQKYLQTGQMPPMGMGKTGAQIRTQIMERAAQMAKEQGQDLSSIPGRQADFKSNQTALSSLNKDLNTFEPYKKMLDKNGDIAIQLGQKIANTNSALANKPLNWLKQNATNNPDVAEYMFQINALQNEAGRVLANPRLVGQMSYEAKKDMESVLNGNMPIPAAERVIQRMKQDGDNRFNAMHEQKQMILGEMTGKSSKPAAPQGIPPGSVQIGKTPDGKDVYQSPDGKKWVP